MIAALWVPDFPLQALQRAESDVPDETRPWGVVQDGTYRGGTPLLNVSPAARGLGVQPGMTVAQARTRVGALEVVTRKPSLEASAAQALEDVACSFSPRFEISDRQGWAYVDISGLGSLFGPPAAIARALRSALGRVGLEGRVGVGRSKALARLVARGGDGCQALAGDQAEERGFVAGLPLAALEPSPGLAATLTRFGLHRVGELLQLVRRGTGELAEHLGSEGVALYHRAGGDDRPGEELHPQPERSDFSERTELDFGIHELEPLAFVLRGLLDRLVTRLSLRSLLAGNLRLALTHEGRGEHECLVEVAAPTRDVRALLSLCRLRLEISPPPQAITGVMICVEPRAPRPRQLSFFEAAGPAPDKLAVTVARLIALCGEGKRVGVPNPLDTYDDDAFSVEPFSLPKSSGVPGGDDDDTWPTMTLRRFRPPRHVVVRCYAGRPACLEGEGLAGRVVSWSGPFRRWAGWWQRDCGVRLDTYDVQLADGVYYRLHFERRGQRWLAVGWYD